MSETYSFWYSETYTHKGYFSAKSPEIAEAMLNIIARGESDIEYLPEFFSKDKGYEVEIDHSTLECTSVREDKMTTNLIRVVGADVSVGEVVESFITNDSINDETLYDINSIEVYGLGRDWDRLTGADISIETDRVIDNQYIDTIRGQFPAVDIQVDND